MVLTPGEKVHAITRRLFEGDLRRHFAGEVQAVTESAARVEGYVFVFDPPSSQFIRRPELRVRIISLVDSGNILTVLPRDIELADLAYRMSEDKRLVVTDGRSFHLDINEFSSVR
jgi:hypothetical protein